MEVHAAAVGPGAAFTPLVQQRAFEQIIVQIEEAIVSGRVRPGDRLPAERELAETFHVSRASVREALRVLEALGVVVARRGAGPDAGSTVAAGASGGLASALRLHTALVGTGARDVVRLRAVLEADAVAEATGRMTAEQAAELHGLNERMRTAPDVRAYHEHDSEFHLTLAAASGNALLPVVMQALRGAVQRQMLDGFARLDDWAAMRDQLVREHADVVARIAAGDGAGAAAAVRAHILGFHRHVMG